MQAFVEQAFLDVDLLGGVRFARGQYSRSSLNGHSRKRTALLAATLFEIPF